MSTSTVETVAVTVSASLAKAIRILARSDKKRNASQLADDLLTQVVRGRLKAKAESAKEEFGDKWDMAAQIMGTDKMPIPKADYAAKAVEELRDVLKDIA